jgi:hypothetical protein
VSEAKMRLHKDDIPALLSACAKLAEIAAQPSLFRSEPAGVAEALAGLAIVPLASSSNCGPELADECRAKRVNLLLRDGTGFRSILADD